MTSQPLITIGHSNRTMEEFVDLITQNRVAVVADVRSHPYSKRCPHFNAQSLAVELRNTGIDYVFLGEELGARRREPECYAEGQAKYELIARTAAFQRGLARIRSELRSHRVALLCSEKDPLTCHRTILVCRCFGAEYRISHVLDADKTETHEQSEARLLDLVGLPSRDLFRSAEELLAEAYEIQGRKIAYREDSRAAATASQDE